MNGLSSILVSLLKRFGHQKRIIILNYHRVLERPDPMAPTEPDALHFERQLCWIKAHFPVISLAEAVSMLSSGHIDSPKVVITFDDGYRNNAEIALPILQKHGLTASFFVVTDELDGGIMWNDVISESFRLTTKPSLLVGSDILSSMQGLTDQQVEMLDKMSFSFASLADRQEQAERLIQCIKYVSSSARQSFIDTLVDVLAVADQLPRDLMMTPEQVKRLADSGMTVGAHACRHDVLTSMSSAEAQHQIAQSKSVLEGITGQSVEFYAYPNGKPDLDYTLEHVQLVNQAGYKAALSTARGAAMIGDDLYQLPRIMPWRRSKLGFNLNLLETLYQ